MTCTQTPQGLLLTKLLGPASQAPPMAPPPMRVQVALGFIAEYNRVRAPVPEYSGGAYDCSPDVRMRRPSAHPAQEGAMRLACMVLGKYFDGTLKDDTVIGQEEKTHAPS